MAATTAAPRSAPVEVTTRAVTVDELRDILALTSGLDGKDATAAPALATIARMMSHRRPLNVVKLSDQGGQCVLTIECGHRGHGRDARPETFARIAG